MYGEFAEVFILDDGINGLKGALCLFRLCSEILESERKAKEIVEKKIAVEKAPTRPLPSDSIGKLKLR